MVTEKIALLNVGNKNWQPIASISLSMNFVSRVNQAETSSSKNARQDLSEDHSISGPDSKRATHVNYGAGVESYPRHNMDVEHT